MPDKVPFVVRCVLLLGLFLTVQVDSENQPNRLIYQIVDTFGIFSWPNDSTNKHIFAIPDPPMGGVNDGKMERTINGVFYNAVVVFNIHCDLAKGIFTNRNNQPMDHYKALPKESVAENLHNRRIAKFLNLDFEHEMSDRNGFATDSRLLENTIELFLQDVVSVQTARLEIEQEKEKRCTKIRKKSEEEKNGLDSTISNAEERRNEKAINRH